MTTTTSSGTILHLLRQAISEATPDTRASLEDALVSYQHRYPTSVQSLRGFGASVFEALAEELDVTFAPEDGPAAAAVLAAEADEPEPGDGDDEPACPRT